jgi:hypothetical protein
MGEATYAQFARKLGITPSTLFRLENRQQSITLGPAGRAPLCWAVAFPVENRHQFFYRNSTFDQRMAVVSFGT